MVLQVPPKVGLGNNCPLLNFNNGRLPRVRRINRYNQSIITKTNKQVCCGISRVFKLVRANAKFIYLLLIHRLLTAIFRNFNLYVR